MTSFKASQRNVMIVMVLVIAMAVQMAFLKSTNEPHSLFSSSVNLDTAGPILKQVFPDVTASSSTHGAGDANVGQPSVTVNTNNNVTTEATPSSNHNEQTTQQDEHTVDADLWHLLLQLRERHDALLEFYTEPSKPKEECTQNDLP